MNRVAITGSSGYLGRELTAFLRRRGSRVLGIDVRPPVDSQPDEFAGLDIADPKLRQVIGRFRADTLIHAAFVVDPSHDLEHMRQVNLEGSHNLIEAVEASPPKKLMLISSATVYGAWPNNPVPIEEERPMRARNGFPYVAHKAAVETLFADFAETHPEIVVSRIRPPIIGGPTMDNYLYRFIFGMPFLVKLDGHDQPLQFVHRDDLVEAIHLILSVRGRGPFNVAPPDHLKMSDVVRLTERRSISLPFWMAHLAYRVGWTLRAPFPNVPPDLLYYARYPWVVRSKRLEEDLGFSFRHTTRETLQEILKGPATVTART